MKRTIIALCTVGILLTSCREMAYTFLEGALDLEEGSIQRTVNEVKNNSSSSTTTTSAGHTSTSTTSTTSSSTSSSSSSSTTTRPSVNDIDASRTNVPNRTAGSSRR